MLHVFFWEQVSFGICGSIRKLLRLVLPLAVQEFTWRVLKKPDYVSSILLYLPKLFPERVYWHHLFTKFFKKPFVSSKFFSSAWSFCPEVSAPSHAGSRRGFHIESFLGRVVHVDNQRPTTTWLFGRIATVVKQKQKKQNDDCWWGNMLHDMGFTCRESSFSSTRMMSTPSIHDAMMLCKSKGDWQQALLWLYTSLEQKLKINVTIYNLAIGTCERATYWSFAIHLLHLQRYLGVAADIVSFTTTMNAAGRASEWQRTLAFLCDLGTLSIQPNLLTLNTCINACSRAFEWQRALAMLQVGTRTSGGQPI